MDIHELKTFIALAETLHFGRAAQACHLSPSAMTRTVHRLEEEVGHQLFLRDRRSVALTTAGEIFLAYARQSCRLWGDVKEQLHDDGVSGTLSIYASITAVYSLLPDLLEAFREQYPQVHLELSTGAAERSIAQVLDGEIDLAVAALPDKQSERLEFMELTRTPLVFIVAKGRAGTIEDVMSEPLVLPRRGLARYRLDQWFKRQGRQPLICSEVSGNEALIAMVRLGCGVGVVPRLVLERSPFSSEVEELPVASPLAPYVVGLCSTKRNLQRSSVASFWALAKHTATK